MPAAGNPDRSGARTSSYRIRLNASAEDPLTLSLSQGREDARILAAGSSGVPSPLGEKDRMRGDFVKHSTGFGITAWRPWPAAGVLKQAHKTDAGSAPVKKPFPSPRALSCLMPAWLTADRHIFRPPLFANFLPFLARFHDSKIRLNIRASFKLTNRGRRCRRQISITINDLPGTLGA